MLQLHRLPTESETEDNKHLPVMSHVSQVKTRGTCNCGNKQMEREDPFDQRVGVSQNSSNCNFIITQMVDVSSVWFTSELRYRHFDSIDDCEVLIIFMILSVFVSRF